MQGYTNSLNFELLQSFKIINYSSSYSYFLSYIRECFIVLLTIRILCYHSTGVIQL